MAFLVIFLSESSRGFSHGRLVLTERYKGHALGSPLSHTWIQSSSNTFIDRNKPSLWWSEYRAAVFLKPFNLVEAITMPTFNRNTTGKEVVKSFSSRLEGKTVLIAGPSVVQ